MEAHTFLLHFLAIQESARLMGEIYTALIVVIACNTLLSPFWIRLYYQKFGKSLE